MLKKILEKISRGKLPSLPAISAPNCYWKASRPTGLAHTLLQTEAAHSIYYANWLLIKSSYLLLVGKTSLRHSRTSTRPLELKTSSFSTNQTTSLRLFVASTQPLGEISAYLQMHSLDLGNFLQTHCPYPSLTLLPHWSLNSPTTDCCYSGKSNSPTVSGVFSKCPLTTSYNPLLEHQRPRLKLNQGLGSSWSRFVWVSRLFSPWLN